jgi:4'-phosphopantetheinyl transferase
VDVVWARPGDLPADAGSATTLLDDVERSRARALRRPADRDRFVAARVLLRVAVAAFAGVDPARVVVRSICPVCGAPHGRPMITLDSRPGPHVSLSHSGDRVLVAVTLAGPVGVDVEPLGDDAFAGDGVDGIDGIALTEAERAALEALPPDRRPAVRARLWVRKEAVLKATGQGLQVPPSEVEVVEAASSTAQGAAQLVDLDVGDGYAACVAVLSPVPPTVSTRRSSLRD